MRMKLITCMAHDIIEDISPNSCYIHKFQKNKKRIKSIFNKYIPIL